MPCLLGLFDRDVPGEALRWTSEAQRCFTQAHFINRHVLCDKAVVHSAEGVGGAEQLALLPESGKSLPGGDVWAILKDLAR